MSILRPASADAGKLDNLQILRALAAFTVVVAHALHERQAINAAHGQSEAAAPFAFGVDIFFVLSGFIMMHTSAREFGAAGASLRFLRRRLARVAPLYWLLTSVMLAGAVAAPSLLNVPIGDAFHVVASYLFIPDARGAGEMRPVMALGWTLNYEMLFYAIFSVALLTPLRFGVVWLTVQMLVMAAGHALIDPSHARAAFWTDPIVLEFLFGVYVALLWRSGRRLGAGAAAALLAIGAIGFVRLGAPYDEMPRFLRYGVPAALLVTAGALGPAVHGRLAGLAVALGDASYSLYLSHPFVLRPARVVWMKLIGQHLPPALFAPLATAAAVAVALALYARVERPLTTAAQGFLHERRRNAALAPTSP